MDTNSLHNFRRLASFRPTRHWALVLALAIAVSGAEAIGALLVYALLGVVTGVEGALTLPVVGDVRAWVPTDDRGTLLLGAAAFIALFFIGRGLLVILQRYVMARVAQTAGAELSARLADGYLALPYAFHLRRNSSELIRNAYSTVQDIVSDVFKPLVRIVTEALIVIGILLVLLVSAPLATALVIALVLPVAGLLLRFVYPRLLDLGIERQEQSRASLQSLQQSLQGLRDLKILGRERYFSDEFRDSRERLARVYYLREVLRDVPNVALETLIVLLVAGLFGAAVLLEGEAVGAVPVLGLFGYAAIRLKPSVGEIIHGVNLLRFSRGGIDDIIGDLDLLEGIRTEPDGGARPVSFEREIRLESVTFRYECAGEDALADIDLRIAKGESIGVVGPTGGGKTTLIDVIAGLLVPTDGAIRVDGRDIRDHLAGWQRNIGLVPQELFLVDDTLRRNIALGMSDEEVDDDQIALVVDLAQLHDVLARLPDGLDTVVGEAGIRLSGGQRQRVAIARALYRSPSVLIFDEGTSALDMETEADLIEALALIREDHTLITVAHRLATVRDCDRVLLIEQGRLVDVGTLDALSRRHRMLDRGVS